MKVSFAIGRRNISGRTIFASEYFAYIMDVGALLSLASINPCLNEFLIFSTKAFLGKEGLAKQGVRSCDGFFHQNKLSLLLRTKRFGYRGRFGRLR